MRLGDLLEELRENILSDRSDQVAGTRLDQLWSDKTLVRYINEAQKRFAKRAECIRDAVTPQFCAINTVVGTDRYPMDPKVIGVLSARFMGPPNPDGADLARAGHANLDTYRAPDNKWFDTSFLVAAAPGKTLAFSTDEGMLLDAENAMNVMTFRTWPMVGAGFAGLIQCRVVRFPSTDLKLSNLDGQPEIPEQYHLNMLDWAGYLALRRPDLDVAGGDGVARAQDLAKSFEAHVEDAKRELKRRMFQPAAWDFGRNGFTYERDYW